MAMKFFRFTIEGDDLNPEEVNVNLPCLIYHKGDTVIKTYATATEYKIFQKTNRWLFTRETNESVDENMFLLNNLKTIENYLKELKTYIEKYHVKIEFVVYAGDDTDICLSKQHLELLHKIGVPFCLSFC